jgi:hypothetical protein
MKFQLPAFINMSGDPLPSMLSQVLAEVQEAMLRWLAENKRHWAPRDADMTDIPRDVFRHQRSLQ